MSAKPDVWMPFYIGDYLADTLHLDAEQHGAYMLLLMAAWMRGGDLPNNDEQLQRIARCNRAAWKRVKDSVMAFFTVSAEKITQKRLVVEYANAVRANEAQRKNGAKGGRPKKPKDNPPYNPNETHGLLGDKPKSNPNETPSPLQELKKDQELPTTSGAEAPPPDPIFGTGLDFLKRKGVPEKPARSFLGLLRKELHDDLTVAELLVEAERQDVSAPQAWLTAAAKQRKLNGGNHATGRQGGSTGHESVADRAARFAREGNEADARRAAANRGDASLVGEDGGDLRASVG